MRCALQWRGKSLWEIPLKDSFRPKYTWKQSSGVIGFPRWVFNGRRTFPQLEEDERTVPAAPRPRPPQRNVAKMWSAEPVRSITSSSRRASDASAHRDQMTTNPFWPFAGQSSILCYFPLLIIIVIIIIIITIISQIIIMVTMFCRMKLSMQDTDRDLSDNNEEVTYHINCLIWRWCASRMMIMTHWMEDDDSD